MSASADSTNAMTAVTANLTCYDVAINARGQKTAALIRDGQPVFWTLPSAATPLFTPSSYKGVAGDSSLKLSLCLNADPDVMKEAEEIDDWAVSYCTAHAEKLFGKVLTRDQVLDRYNSVVKRNEKYPPFLKLKISDRNEPNYWDANRQGRSAPENWQACQILCRCKIYGFWFMSTSFGLSVQLTDAQILEESSVSCPF